MRRLNGLILSTAVAAIVGATGGTVQAASAKAQSRAYADSANVALATFDYGRSGTNWGGYWFQYSDVNSVSAADSTLMGNSYFRFADSASGNPFPNDTLTGAYDPRTYPVDRSGDTTLHAYHMGFALGTRKLSCGAACSYEAYIGWGINFTYKPAPDDTIDLTGSTGISFWAKADTDTVTVSFSVSTLDTAGYSQEFHIGPTWAKYTCKLVASADFKQPSYVTQKPFKPSLATGIGWNFNRGSNAKHPTNGIIIDDVLIEHWTEYPPFDDAVRPVARASAAHAGWRLQVQGSQIRLVRPDGDRMIPLNLNGRALPVR